MSQLNQGNERISAGPNTAAWFWVGALVLGLAVRMVNLGALPLTDSEAAAAQQALDLARGVKGGMGPQVAYVQLTGLLFFLFSSAPNFVARFWPAVFGSLVVVVPALGGVRRVIGRTPALILAFALALDPSLVSLSRQAGSPILADSGLLLAVGLRLTR